MIRAFDLNGKWIGNLTVAIDGNAFAGSIWNVGGAPKMNIQYTIEPW